MGVDDSGVGSGSGPPAGSRPASGPQGRDWNDVIGVDSTEQAQRLIDGTISPEELDHVRKLNGLPPLARGIPLPPVADDEGEVWNGVDDLRAHVGNMVWSTNGYPADLGLIDICVDQIRRQARAEARPVSPPSRKGSGFVTSKPGIPLNEPNPRFRIDRRRRWMVSEYIPDAGDGCPATKFRDPTDEEWVEREARGIPLIDVELLARALEIELNRTHRAGHYRELADAIVAEYTRLASESSIPVEPSRVIEHDHTREKRYVSDCADCRHNLTAPLGAGIPVEEEKLKLHWIEQGDMRSEVEIPEGTRFEHRLFKKKQRHHD